MKEFQQGHTGFLTDVNGKGATQPRVCSWLMLLTTVGGEGRTLILKGTHCSHRLRGSCLQGGACSLFSLSPEPLVSLPLGSCLFRPHGRDALVDVGTSSFQ